jgi:hypothetical protein
MTKGSATTRVLAIDPTRRGIGYVVFETPEFLVDWGVKNVRRPNDASSLKAIVRLVQRCRPEVVVIEDTASSGSRRRGSADLLLRQIMREASRAEIRVCRISRADIVAEFSSLGGRTKYEIARLVAQRLPELQSRLPPERKAWMSEDQRMAIFDAAAFALTFFSGANHVSAARKKSQIVQ